VIDRGFGNEFPGELAGADLGQDAAHLGPSLIGDDAIAAGHRAEAGGC
jgi:hypothetical protein